MKRSIHIIRRQMLLCYVMNALCLLSATQGYSQLQGRSKIDSLLNEISKQKKDTNMVNLFCCISNAYHSIDPDEGVKFGKQALSLATKLNWAKGLANRDAKIGLNYQFKSDYSKAPGPNSVCEGLNISLTDGTAGGTWSSSNSSIAAVSSTGTVSGNSGGRQLSVIA
jgi:hypothetical protein